MMMMMKKKEIKTIHNESEEIEQGILQKKLNRKILIAIFLLFFVSIVLIRNSYYIKMDSGPKLSDNQYIRSLYYYRAFFLDEDVNLRKNFYPPVVYLTTQIYYFFLGVGYETSRISMSFYMLIFLLAMFAIGYELGGAFSGAATMALAASSPYVLNISVKYFLDFPCAAMVAVSLYFLLKTKNFRDRKYSLLFGIIFTIALLTKNFTAFYLFFPVLWMLLPNITKSGHSFFTFLILSIPPLFMVAGSIYYINLISNNPFIQVYTDRWAVYYISIIVLPGLILVATTWFFDKNNVNDNPDEREAISGLINFSRAFSIFTIGAMPWYFWALKANILYYNLQKNDQFILVGRNAYIPIMQSSIIHIVGFLFNSYNLAFLFTVTGLIFFIVFRKHLHRNLGILFGLIFTIILMGTTLHYQFRYLLPMIVFLAVIGGYWISYMGKLKPILMATIVGISLASILVWVPIQPGSKYFLSHDTGYLYSGIIRAGILYPYPPERQIIYSDEALQYLFPKESSGLNKVLFYYFEVPDAEYIYYFQGEALKQDNIIRLADMWRDEEVKDIDNIKRRFANKYHEVFKNTDYIITIYKDDDPDKALQTFNKLFPGVKFINRTFEISDDGYFMTISKILWK